MDDPHIVNDEMSKIQIPHKKCEISLISQKSNELFLLTLVNGTVVHYKDKRCTLNASSYLTQKNRCNCDLHFKREISQTYFFL